MKRLIQWTFVLSLLFSIAACGKDEDPVTSTEPEEVLPIAVTLEVAEQAQADEPVKLEAVVKQGEELVEDADKVAYEVWEEGKKDESKMIDASHDKDGLYAAEITFEHDGLFHVQVHVDARGQHMMPVSEITIGEGGHYDAVEKEQNEHAHEGGFSMHFMKPEDVKAGDEKEVTVHLQLDDEALKEARVRYEIWQDGAEDKKDWVEAEESKAGEYSANYTFAETGNIHIQVHVEAENDLHEHEQFTVEVQ